MAETPMDPRIRATIRRYLSYHWGNSLIVSLIRFQFDAPITSRCVDNLRADRACSNSCAAHCRLKTSRRWFVPKFSDPSNAD